MKKFILVSVVTFSLFGCSKKEIVKEQKPLVEYVNPFIGTGGHGHTYPGASSPFGGVQLSPDTRLEGWDGCGGYHYSDSIIYGFSHTHLSGTGVSDYGDVLFMPVSHKSMFVKGYAQKFSHNSENAEAGYYEVDFINSQINTKLTATERCGFHQYTYPEGEMNLIIDLFHRDKLLDYNLKIGKDFISGKRISKAWAEEQHVYFYAQLSSEIIEYEYNDDSTKVMLSFDNSGELKTKVGISAVSVEGAQKNLEAEIPHWDFEKTKKETQEKWNKELGKIEVDMMTEEETIVFYTALYHTFLNPNIFQDVDGKYRGTDLQIHQTENFNNYTIFSLWDTYRATHPLFTITQREKTLDFINTFLNQYKNGGKLPVWELAGSYTGCMIGYHSIPVIVDAYQKGITDFDTELALEAMIKTATANELGKEHYIEKGYMASDEEHESVSKNLEYAYDDWCIAQFAKSLGNEVVYAEYMQRAQNYKNIFEPETGFMRAKRNQQFTEPFNPTEVNFNFTEANSWQYSFYVPQDISGLIELHGGNENFEQKLDELFTTSEETSGRQQADITGLIGQYAHGNEPSHHMAYLYNYVGKPHKTQEKVRQILNDFYPNDPDGLIGNEDCGQMSSWYVLSALGFYPVTPGSTDYIIGSPNVKYAKINLENGKNFEIEVKNQSKENIYINSIQLNGKDYYDKEYITHDDIMNGGKMVFFMGNKPNSPLASPISKINEHLITPIPYIISDGQVFFEELKLSLNCVDQGSKIYYTLDGSTPSTNSTLYGKEIILTESTEIKAIAIAEGKSSSKMIHGKFFKVDQRRKVTYKNRYDSQYAGGEEKGLIDYIRGGDDFRTGNWQGWQGQDVEVVIDLEKPQMINKISSGYIQDIKSWIFMPKSVKYYTSQNGKDFIFAGEAKTSIADNKYGAIVDELGITIKGHKARYVKVVAEHYGKIPDWHLGAGNDSWLFIDEIIIE